MERAKPTEGEEGRAAPEERVQWKLREAGFWPTRVSAVSRLEEPQRGFAMIAFALEGSSFHIFWQFPPCLSKCWN